MLLAQTSTSVAVRAAPRRARCIKTLARKQRLDTSGFVAEDNSGKGNIFPTQTKSFYSSPTSEQAARQGLGGTQGAGVLAGAIALVGMATAAVVFQGTGETLTQVQSNGVESLSAIADRIAASL